MNRQLLRKIATPAALAAACFLSAASAPAAGCPSGFVEWESSAVAAGAADAPAITKTICGPAKIETLKPFELRIMLSSPSGIPSARLYAMFPVDNMAIKTTTENIEPSADVVAGKSEPDNTTISLPLLKELVTTVTGAPGMRVLDVPAIYSPEIFKDDTVQKNISDLLKIMDIVALPPAPTQDGATEYQAVFTAKAPEKAYMYLVLDNTGVTAADGQTLTGSIPPQSFAFAFNQFKQVTLVKTNTVMTFKDNPWVTIPAGRFVMGCASSDTKCDSNELPRHDVDMTDYSILKNEVSNKQYKSCVDAGFCTRPQFLSSETRSSYYENIFYDDYPVVWVSWHQAASFCKWAGGSLPTEAQWEKAARGPYPSESLYSWGDDAPTEALANRLGGIQKDTNSASSYPSGDSRYGVSDLNGNVMEWTADWFDSTYYITSPGSSPKGPKSSPTGQRTVRNGSFLSDETLIRSSKRAGVQPDTTQNDIGFRCVADTK